MSEEWSIPTTAEELERAGERFRVAAAALHDLNTWLEHGGEPSMFITERMVIHDMTAEEYREYWRTFKLLDSHKDEEIHAIEDSAIHKVQPNWKRNPNPKYPKG